MASERAFRFWHEKDRFAAGCDEHISNKVTSKKSQSNRRFLHQLDVLPDQQSEQIGKQLQQTSGIVASLKEKWEHKHDRGRQKGSQSPPQHRALHKPVRKSNSSSPPARRPQLPYKRNANNGGDECYPHNIKSTSLHSSISTMKSVENRQTPSIGRMSVFTKKRPSLPAFISNQKNDACIAPDVVQVYNVCFHLNSSLHQNMYCASLTNRQQIKLGLKWIQMKKCFYLPW